MNINYKNFVDNDKLMAVLDANRGKKIICFGAGTAPYIVKYLLPKELQVAYYVDNNQRLWGTEINGELVLSPKSILDENRNEIIVLIVSQHALSISKELEQWGFEQNRDYFDLFTLFEKAFRIQKIAFQAENMISFINKIPFDAFDHTEYKNDKKIGVVAVCGFMGTPMIYDIGIFILLNYFGYRTELILDHLYSCENFVFYEGVSKDIKEIIDQVIEKLQNRFPKLIIKYLDEEKTSKLDACDLKRVEYQVHLNTIWQKSRQNQRTMKMSEEDMRQKFYKTFYNNLEVIKAFFNENTYDILSLSTALHYHRGLYMWMGEVHHMRVANYDGANSDGKTSWATDFPNGHHYDIPKLVLGNYFTKDEKAEIISRAKEHFEIRRGRITDGNLYNYQPVLKNEVNTPVYDVIIPLNVMWDAAAIGINFLFDSEVQWLTETIQYILNRTKANILVREHPVQVQLQKYNNGNYNEVLKNYFGENARLRIVQYDEKINTYGFIEQCKAVLPLSSTVGVESAFMGKKVIVHSKCYYSKLDFVEAPETKEEYFKAIKRAVEDSSAMEEISDNAWIAYYLLMNSRIGTVFSEANPEWLFMDIVDLCGNDSVRAIIDAIAEDIPIPYYNMIKSIHNS